MTKQVAVSKKSVESVSASAKRAAKVNSNPNKKALDKVKNIKDSLSDEVAELNKKVKKSKVDVKDSKTWNNTYGEMFISLQETIANMESRVSKTNHSQDIYALMALYNQMREVIADLRAMEDSSQHVQKVIDNILYPMTRDIGNNFVDVIFVIKKMLREHVSTEKFVDVSATLNECLRDHARYIQGAYEKSSDKLTKMYEET